MSDYKRFTTEEALAAMKEHGVHLKHHTWGFTLGYSGRGHDGGCAAALMVLARVGGRDAYDTSRKDSPDWGTPFQDTFATLSGVPRDYLDGLEAGFDHNKLYRDMIGGETSPSEDFLKGMEDGAALIPYAVDKLNDGELT